MQPRSFLSLLIVTLAAVIAAAVVRATAPQGGTVSGSGEPAFPQLLHSAQQAEDILIVSGKGSVHLVRGADNVWIAPDQGGYRADPLQVRQLLLDAGKLRLAERKTDNPARLAKLWLEEPDGPATASLRLTIKAADGLALVDAIVGRVTNDLVGEQEGGTYLRYPGETQAWLAAGKLSVSPDPVDWFDRALVNLPPDTVRRVVVTRADGQVILAERAKGDPALAVKTGLAAGQSADPAALRQLAGLLDGLIFADVARADDRPFPPDAVNVTVTSFDGIEVRLTLALLDEQPWARITAVLAEEHTADQAALQGIQDFVAALEAKTAGWAFQLSPAAYEGLTPTPQTLTTPP